MGFWAWFFLGTMILFGISAVYVWGLAFVRARRLSKLPKGVATPVCCYEEEAMVVIDTAQAEMKQLRKRVESREVERKAKVG